MIERVMHRPSVAVAILSHRPEMKPLAEASVRAQTYTDWEIVTKESRHYWPDKINDLIRGVSADYYALLPDDDQLAPTFLARHMEVAAAHPEADIIYCDVAVIGDYMATPVHGGHAMIPVHINLPEFDAEVLRFYCVPFMGCLVRTAKGRNVPHHNGVHGYDGDQDYVDWDWAIAMCQAGARAIHLRGEYLYEMRSHTGNGSKIMNNDGALQMLRRKHSALAQPVTP